MRGKLVEVHETADGSVTVRDGSIDLPAHAFRKDGCVRQRDIDDDKYLGKILKQIQREQLARDEAKLATLRTLRERRKLKASMDERKGITSAAP